jgi:hypothetical protein
MRLPVFKGLVSSFGQPSAGAQERKRLPALTSTDGSRFGVDLLLLPVQMARKILPGKFRNFPFEMTLT